MTSKGLKYKNHHAERAMQGDKPKGGGDDAQILAPHNQKRLRLKTYSDIVESMSDAIELAIENSPEQNQIFHSPAKFKIVAKGRRFGLTRGAANDFIECALNGTFLKGLWVDTVNSNIDRYVERYFIPHLRHLPTDMWDWRKQAKILEIANSYIDFRSVDRPENLEGFGYDKAFLNEAGIILKDEYLWRNAIAPMFWDHDAQVVIGGTPKGRGVFYELALRGKSTDLKHAKYQFFHFTSFQNSFMTHIHDRIREDMSEMPENVIKQEIYAEFLEDTGVVFRGVRDAATAVPQKPINGHLYVMGVDLAKVTDYTVIIVYDRTNNHQVYHQRFNKLDWPFQKTKIIETSRHFNNALVYLDATGLGDPIADDLIRAGVPVEPVKLANENKKEIIEKMVVWIEQQKIKLINIPEAIEEFNSFTYDVTSTGRIRYSAPVGLHDDIVMAHGLAVRGLQPIIPQAAALKELNPIQLARRRKRENYADYDPV